IALEKSRVNGGRRQNARWEKISRKAGIFGSSDCPARPACGASSSDGPLGVNTRVLQAVFRIQSSRMPLFVGQQIDVFIDQAAMASTSIAVSQEGFPRDSLLPKIIGNNIEEERNSVLEFPSMS